MFGHVPEELHELFLVHGLLLVVVLLHEGRQDLLVLELGLALGVYWVVQGTDHLGEQFDGDRVVEVVVECQCSEDLFWGQLFTVHFYYYIWEVSH